jgi:hypothetical protein
MKEQKQESNKRPWNSLSTEEKFVRVENRWRSFDSTSKKLLENIEELLKTEEYKDCVQLYCYQRDLEIFQRATGLGMRRKLTIEKLLDLLLQAVTKDT